MPDRFVESHITQLPLFQDLPEPQLDLIVRAFQALRFEPDQVVVQEGNQTQGLFIVVSGGGVLTQQTASGEKPVGFLGPNDTLDRGALFSSGREEATLRITEPSQLLFLSRSRMDTILSYYPEIRNRLGASDDGTTAAPARPIRPHARDAAGTGHNIHRENETIIMIRRRHPWSFIRRGWMCVLIFAFFSAAGVVALTASNLIGFSLIGVGFVIAGLLMTYFYFEWRNDSIAVTDQRVIQIERVIPTFSVTINEIPIEHIQEVNTELPTGDLFARIFNYGDLELKNASDAGNLVLDMVPQPDEVQDAIFANREQRQKYAEETHRSAIRADIERQLGIGAPGATPPPRQDTEDGSQAQAQQDYDYDQYTTASSFDNRQNSGGLTRSFSPAPMRFTNASGDTVVRKHVTIWLAAIFAPTVTVIGGFIVMALSIAAREGWVDRLGIPLALGMFVIGGLWFWWADWDWRNDMYILGDEKVTLIHKRPLWLQNEVEQIRLERVDNVLSETSGLIDTMFQRGNVKLSLVGEGLDKAKVFHKVHRPHQIQAEVTRRQARARNLSDERENERQRETIQEYLSVYHEAVNDQPPPKVVKGEAVPHPSEDPEQKEPARRQNRNVRPGRRQDGSRPPQVPRVRSNDPTPGNAGGGNNNPAPPPSLPGRPSDLP